MSDRGIIFSAPMVRALLAGTKTQTRRMLGKAGHCNIFEPGIWSDSYVLDPGNADWRARDTPFAVGDRLYVREACRAQELSNPPASRPSTKRERENLGRTSVVVCDELDGADGVRYLADDSWAPIGNTRDAGEAWSVLFHYGQKAGARPDGRVGKTVPSIHMPRWASRLTLIVEAVRTQRLHDIDEDDAKAEGVEMIAGRNYRDGFAILWNSLHTARNDRWEDNPWVVAVSFTVTSCNIDQVKS